MNQEETYDCCLKCKSLYGNALLGDSWVCKHPKYDYEVKIPQPLHHLCDDFEENKNEES